MILTEGLEVVMLSLLGKKYDGHAIDAAGIFSIWALHAQKRIDCKAGVLLRLNA